MTAADPDFDIAMMRLALEEARKALPSPNPPVGAVIVADNGEVIVSAHHARAGEDHAEVAALRRAGDAARGGTLYVTLEPCNHHGRTPPCVDVIKRSGLRRVVVGCVDPNPNVEGGGIATMQHGGLVVDVGVAEAEARALIAPWTKFITQG